MKFQRAVLSLIAILCMAVSAAFTTSAARADWRRDNAEACARIDSRLQAIEAQRRLGYTPKRGRQLQAEREKLMARRRELCR